MHIFIITIIHPLAAGTYQLKIVTQYRSGVEKTEFTKTTREGVFDKVLTVK